LGSITIPLSLVVTGAQLGAIHITGHRPSRAMAGIVLLRLILVPLLMLPIAWLIQHSPWPMPFEGMMVGLIIAAMPVAVGSSIYTQRFNQDTQLAAQSILYTTFLSIITVPAFFSLANHLLK
jgi:malate permease and related proteins